jgi:ubiquinone/menaquinone biosynthesis C-methylase UbiE
MQGSAPVNPSESSAAAAQGAVAADPWEAAYLRFETPEEEIRKFIRRHKRLRTDSWPRDAEIVELFCGRGNGLRALTRLGFHNIEGVDLSWRLLAHYHGPAQCYACDCRKLPFADESKDMLICQGGLHHLPLLPDDFAQTMKEMRRVLRKDGRLIIVEPWMTPFLRFLHVVSENPLVRRISNKMEAFATMIHYERRTYERWLGRPEQILDITHAHFLPLHESFAWGKWCFLGKPR